MVMLTLKFLLLVLYCSTIVSATARQYTFDIIDYGADPSGKTDSTGYIQQAIDGAQSVGGFVVVPPGLFLISSTLNITAGIRIEGVSPQTSVILSHLRTPGEFALTISGATGMVISDLGFQSAVAGHDGGICSLNNMIVSFNNLQFKNPWIGIWLRNTGNVDMYSINIWSHTQYAIRILDVNGDMFLSNIHTNNHPSTTGVGLYLSNVSGGKFTNSDFIGGAQGVFMDIASSQPNPQNYWNQFLSVDCDTVSNDPWHIVNAYGLQMSECWSGSFFTGTGIWLGTGVTQVSIVNHQFQSGDIGIGNNGNGITVTGGIMGGVTTPIDSSVSGQPVVSNLGIY